MAALSFPHREHEYEGRMHPLKFLMWVYLVSMVMMFAAFTSALLVSKPDNVAKGVWHNFDLPWEFLVSTGVILVSSATMHLALNAARKNNFNQTTAFLWVTALLGVAFVFTQIMGFMNLIEHNVFLVGLPKTVQDSAILRDVKMEFQTVKNDTSGSFVFVIVGAHLLHLLAAISVVIIMLIKAIRLKINAQNIVGLELSTTFWHALDLLWIYLFLFLSITYS